MFNGLCKRLLSSFFITLLCALGMMAGVANAVADPVMLKDIQPGSGSGWPSENIRIGETLFFSADDGTNGAELWKSDGTVSGTSMVKNIRTGSASSNPESLTNVNGILYFTANDGTHGIELWKSDGTESGTVMVKDIWANSSSAWPYWLADVNGTLYFSADDGTHGSELWKSDGTESGTVMVKDICSGSCDGGPTDITDEGPVIGMVNIGGTIYFVGSDGTHGWEIWKSDGTESGTVMVKDILVGSNSFYPYYLVGINGTLYFRHTDGTAGYELWKSDGTENGTVMVKDIRVGSTGSLPYYLTNINGTLYLSADDGTHGRQLWKSDGTANGTVMVTDFFSGQQWYMKYFNGMLYFVANDGTHGYELWKSDGTTNGTVMVKDIAAGGGDGWPIDLNYINGKLYFGANDRVNGRELWTSDGTESGTFMVKDINSGDIYDQHGYSEYMTEINEKIYFAGNDRTNGWELWVYDTNNPAPILSSIDPISAIIGSADTVLTLSGSGFSNDSVVKWESTSLTTTYVSSSSLQATIPAALLETGGSNDITVYTPAPGGGTSAAQNFDVTYVAPTITELFPTCKIAGNSGFEMTIAGTGFTTNSVVKVDGNSRTTTLISSTTLTASIISSDLITSGDKTITVVNPVGEGGSSAGMAYHVRADAQEPCMVRDILPGSGDGYPWSFATLNGEVYFEADDGVHGYELWKSDGTYEGTVMVKDIIPGSGQGDPYPIVNAGGTLYFRAIDPSDSDRQLWKSDGTESGTVLVKDLNPTGSSSLNHLTNVNGTLYFIANDGTNGLELWKSDGTTGGTVMVKNINSVGSSVPSNLTNVNGTLYFYANDGSNGAELWKTDGTSGGTVMVKDINPGSWGSDSSEAMVNVNGTLYFKGNDGTNGEELWKSDGTESGTVMVKDIQIPGSGSPGYLTDVDGTLYFTADDGTNGQELWKSDGTSGGTVMVKIINSTGHSMIAQVIYANGMLYFIADDGTHGLELWKSDGTEVGTSMVKDISAGSADGYPYYLTNINDTVYFEASDGTHGWELWKSDGTSDGTFMIKDIWPGDDWGDPYEFIVANGILLFPATDGVHGYELWMLGTTEEAPLPAPVITSYTFGDGATELDPSINAMGTDFVDAVDEPGQVFAIDDSNNTQELTDIDFDPPNLVHILSGLSCAHTTSFFVKNHDGQESNHYPFSCAALGVPVPKIIKSCSFTDVSAGYSSVLALKDEGSVWAWGSNGSGQLGDGTTDQKLSPIQIPGLTNVTAVSEGYVHSLALKDDGTVWAWGNNNHGQLGDGTTDESHVPIHVQSLTNIVAIAAGDSYSMAVKDDGTVWAWGANFEGQLGMGNGSSDYNDAPIQVPGLTNIVAIGAADGVYESQSAALQDNGTVWVWGSTYLDPVYVTYSPVTVTGLSNITKISVSNGNFFVTKNDGTVWAWGVNREGSLGMNGAGLIGDGAIVDDIVYTPTQITGLTGIIDTSGGRAYAGHRVAIKADGSIWAWGANYYGQLGDGTTTNQYSPVPIDYACRSAINPNHGLSAGGTLITINGSGFTPGTTVKLGNSDATGVTIVDINTITAFTPPHVNGAVDVTVTNTNDDYTLTNGYTYSSTPVITSVVPSSGTYAGGTTVTINGSEFAADATVIFGGISINPSAVNRVSETMIITTAPTHAEGQVQVRVTNPNNEYDETGYEYLLIEVPDIIYPDPKPIVATGNQRYPRVTYTADGNYIMMWTDSRNGNNDIYAQKIRTSDGAELWTAGGVQVTSSGNNEPQGRINMIKDDGNGGAIIGWDMYAGGTSQIKAQHLDGTDGHNLWATDGVTLYENAIGASIVDMLPAGDGGVYISWEEVSTYSGGVTHITPAGTVAVGWNTSGSGTYRPVTTFFAPRLGAADGGGILIGHSDSANNAAPYVTKLSADGTQIWSTPLVDTNEIDMSSWDLVVQPDGHGGAIAVYDGYDNDSGLEPARAQHIDSGGNRTWGDYGIEFYSYYPYYNQIISIGNDSFISLFETWDAQAKPMANRFDINGNMPWSAAVPLYDFNEASNQEFQDWWGSFRADNNSIISIFQDNTSESIRLQKISTDGSLKYGTTGFNIASASSPVIANNGVNNALFAWEKEVTDDEYKVYYQSMRYGTPTSAAPTITPPLNPNQGPTGGGTTVTITGTGFRANATVIFGTQEAADENVVVVDSTTITAVTPAHAAGAVGVTVTNEDATTTTLNSGYTYNAPLPAPVITSYSFGDGAMVLAPSINAVGTDFVDTVDDPAQVFAVDDSNNTQELTDIDFDPPNVVHILSGLDCAHTTSFFVKNHDGQESNRYPFNCTAIAAPIITSPLNPNQGPTSGGTLITINGSGFRANATVKFDTTDATGVTQESDTRITAVTPAHAAGAVNVTVTNADATTNTLNNGYTYDAAPPRIIQSCSFTDADLHGMSTLALKDGGTVWGWGEDYYGQLGQGNTLSWEYSPVRIPGLTDIIAVSAGDAGSSHSVALKSDGTVWAWGSNGQGQLGTGIDQHGYTIDAYSPVQVPGISGVTAVSAGLQFTLALKANGTVWAWGANGYGQLGDGSTDQRNSPVQITGISGVTAISAGKYHSLALKNDGTVWAWGFNNHGQLGNGNTTDQHSPIQITGLSGITAISASGIYENSGWYGGHSVVLKNDGTVWAWGGNDHGQLGDGSTTERHSPVEVTGLTGITKIAAGGSFTVALKNDATVWTWGFNEYGQLGDGSTTDRYSPAAVTGITGVSSISAGRSNGSHIVVVKNDGTVLAWGYNSYGQIGDGTTTDRHSPVSIDYICNNGIDPNHGSSAGGAVVTINGANFRTGATVKFGTDSATVSELDSTTITVLTPPHAAGAVNVTVTNEDATTSTLTNGYTYESSTCPSTPTSTTTSNVGYYDLGTVAIDNYSIAHTINVASRGDAFPWSQRYTYSALDFSDLMSSAGANKVAQVPQVIINSADTMVPVQVKIPQCATVTSDSGWDGKIGEPRDSGGNITSAVLAEIATPGKTAVLKYAMEIGDYYYHTYSLDKAVRIQLSGQAGYTAGYFTRPLYYTSNNAAKIPTECSADNQTVGDELPTNGNCWKDIGGDKIIWTKYMNEFFTYDEIDPTSVSNVSPANGPSAGGTFVTITGTGFRDGVTVKFGDASSNATNIVVVNDTTITATTPAHFVGAVSVIVTNSDQTNGIKTNGFTFNGSTPTPPVVSNVVPDNGIYSGGTVVTVSGSNFSAPVTVLFGGSGVGGTVVDSSTITVTTPTHAVGNVRVAVRNADASLGVKQNAFDFTPGGSPSTCPASPTGSSTVNMNDSSHEDGVADYNTEKVYNVPSTLAAADIDLSSLASQVSSRKTARLPKIKINYNSSTHGVVVDIPQCTTVNSQAGWNGKIRAPKEKAASTVGAYLNSIRPAGGGLAAVDSVISIGDSSQRITFDRAVRIKFIGMAGKKVGYVSGGTITKISNICSEDSQVMGDALPEGGDCSIDVSPDLIVWSKHFTDFVTYDEENPPTVTGVTPAIGSQNGGRHVTVAGTNFGTGATVTFGGSLGANVDVLNNTQIAIDTPLHAAGQVDVVVTNPNLLQGTKTNGFTYVDYTPGVAPTITDINPPTGDVAGNTHVTISGTNFGTGLGVTLGGVNAAHVSVDNNTQIQLDSPPHSAGAVNVTVTNPDSMAVTSTGGYTYTGTQETWTQQAGQNYTQEIICPQNPVFSISKTPNSVNWQDKTVSSQEVQSYDKLLADDTSPSSANLMTVSDYRSGGADECPLTSRGFVVTAQLSADLSSGTAIIPRADVRVITSNEGLTSLTGEDASYSVADNTGNRHNVTAPVLYDDYLRDPLVSFAKFNQPDPYTYLAVSGGNATSPSGTPGSGVNLNNAFNGIVTLLSSTTSHSMDISTNVALKLAIPGNTDPGVYTGTITYTLMAQ